MLEIQFTDQHIDLAGPDMIKFGIESKHSSPKMSTKEFQHAISVALEDMRRVCLEAASPQL
jgi:hypothetical protein